jgi:WD40 repeat protein
MPVLGLLVAPFAAADAPQPIAISVPSRTQPVSYAKEVAEILDAKCTGCHSSALAENKFNMETVAGMLKGGKRGPAIVPGSADKSLLFVMGSHRAEPLMPPKDKKEAKPLTPEELGLIKLWIDAGAKDDSAENAAPAKAIELGSLPPGVQPIVAVDITADGKRIAAGRANRVQVYDAESGEELVSLAGHKDIIQSIRFSPDGKMLAAGGYQVVTLWTCPIAAEGKGLFGHSDLVKALTATADGRTILSAGLDKTIRTWHTADGKEGTCIDQPAAGILSLALSSDGRLLATGGMDGIVRIWNIAVGTETVSLKGHTGQVESVAFCADGKRIASASADGTVRLWTLPDEPGKPAAEPVVLKGHTGAVHAVVALHGGDRVVSAGEDGTIRVWPAIGGDPQSTVAPKAGAVLSLALHPQRELAFAGCADKNARLIDVSKGEVVRTFGNLGAPTASVAFSPSGSRMAAGLADGSVRVWDVGTGAVLAVFKQGAAGAPPQAVQAVAFAGEDEIVSAFADRTVKTWTVRGSWTALQPLGPHVFRVLGLDFSPDAKLLATGGGEPSRSGEVKIWEVPSGKLVRTLETLHSDTVFGVRFSPDGSKLASCAADKFMKVVDVATGKELRSFEGHTHHVLAVDWRSDGKQLISGGADNVLKVWDFEPGEQLRTLQAAGKQITAVRWVPNKPLVAGASGDKLVRYWNPDNGAVQRNFNGPDDYVFGVATSADGTRVTAGGADGVLFFWNGDNAQVLRKLAPPEPRPSS